MNNINLSGEPSILEKKLTDPFHSVDKHNEELYQFLSENPDEGGRPVEESEE